MGNNASSNFIPRSNLAIEIDKIASKYILSQNYNDMNKLSDQGHCNKLVVLTAKIIDQNLSPLEQKEVVDRISLPKKEGEENKEDQKVIESDKEDTARVDEKKGEDTAAAVDEKNTARVEDKPILELDKGKELKEETDVDKGEIKKGGGFFDKSEEKVEDCVKIAKFYVKIAHLYAAIMKTVNPVIISTDEKGKNKKYDLTNKQKMPSDAEIKQIQHNNFCTTRINTLLQESDYDTSDPKNKLLNVKPRYCTMNLDPVTKKTRKFYEGDKNETNVGGGEKSNDSKKKNNNKKKVKNNNDDNDEDNNNNNNKKSSKKNGDDDDDDEEEEGEEEEENEEGEEEEEGKRSEKKGSEKGNKKKGNEEKNLEEEGKETKKKIVEKPIKEIPLIIDSTEVGIPELMKLYYDVYDEKTGDFTSMSPEMIKKYQADVETFYKTFTGKEVETDENGNKKITKFEQIPLQEFHKSEGCRPDGMFTKPYEGSLNSNFGKENMFEKYAKHVNKMMNTMNSNQDKLLGIVKQLFKFKPLKKPEDEKKKKEREEREKKLKEMEEKEKKEKDEENIKKKEEEKNKEKEEGKSSEENKTSENEKETAAPNIIQGLGQGPAAQAPGQEPAKAVEPAAQAPGQEPAKPVEPAAQAQAQAQEPAKAVEPAQEPAKAIETLEKKEQAVASVVKLTEPASDIQAGGSKKEEELKEAIINPALDEDKLNSLINSARKLIVNLYITCENDFVEGIHIFEALVSIQLGKTNVSKINLLNEISFKYLSEHTEV